MGRVRWSPDEDGKLYDYMERNGGEPRSWKNVPRDAGLSWRTPRSCKLRWREYLRQDINKNPLSEEEKVKIIELQKQYINRWEEMARLMPGRTATMIKNFWNALPNKLSKQDPQVSPRNPVGIGFGPTSVPDASSIPAPVSASLEPSKADQVEEIVEGTPADQEIANRYSSTSTTFEASITDLKDNENNDDLGSEDIPLASIFSDCFRPEDISVDSIFNY